MNENAQNFNEVTEDAIRASVRAPTKTGARPWRVDAHGGRRRPAGVLYIRNRTATAVLPAPPMPTSAQSPLDSVRHHSQSLSNSGRF